MKVTAGENGAATYLCTIPDRVAGGGKQEFCLVSRLRILPSNPVTNTWLPFFNLDEVCVFCEGTELCLHNLSSFMDFHILKFASNRNASLDCYLEVLRVPRTWLSAEDCRASKGRM